MQVQTGVSDIEAGIWTCGVRPPDPGSNVQMPREQACLRSVPLESPGDGNRNRCDREGPRGGRLGEDRDMEGERRGKQTGAKATQSLLLQTRRDACKLCAALQVLNASARRTNTACC
jgi:hypothetical protein